MYNHYQMARQKQTSTNRLCNSTHKSKDKNPCLAERHRGTVWQTWPKGSDPSGGGCYFGTFLLLWRSRGTCTPTLLAPRGWHRLAIATTCCNAHTLTHQVEILA